MMNPDLLALHPIFSLLEPTKKGLGDLRVATKAHLQTLDLEDVDAKDYANEAGGLTAAVRMVGVSEKTGDGIGVGFKFHTFKDGSMAVELILTGGTTKDLAAALDIGASTISAMDAHALSEAWLPQ